MSVLQKTKHEHLNNFAFSCFNYTCQSIFCEERFLNTKQPSVVLFFTSKNIKKKKNSRIAGKKITQQKKKNTYKNVL